MLSKPLKRPRGHPPADLAQRCRVWVWYYGLKKLKDASDDQLDWIAVKPAAPTVHRKKKAAEANTAYTRRRLFNRIKHFGYEPRKRKFRQKERSLMEIMEMHKDYQGSSRLYTSRFWDLIVPPQPSLVAVRDIITQEATHRGFRRFSETEIQVARSLGLSQSLSVPSPTADPPLDLRPLTASADIDDLALLGALYIEALATASLEEAIAYREALRKSVALFVRHYQLANTSQMALPLLVERRIVKGQWDHPPTATALLSDRLMHPNQALMAEIPDLAIATAALRKADQDNSGYPRYWIPITPRVEEFIKSYPQLRKEAARRTQIEIIQEMVEAEILDRKALSGLKGESTMKTAARIIHQIKQR